MLKPFQMIWELIEFGIQALFVYVLVVILAIGILVLSLTDDKGHEEIEYIKIKNPVNERMCTRIDGCRILKDGTIEW